MYHYKLGQRIKKTTDGTICIVHKVSIPCLSTILGISQDEKCYVATKSLSDKDISEAPWLYHPFIYPNYVPIKSENRIISWL